MAIWQIPQKIKSIVGSLLLAAVLLLVIFWAIGSGQKSAQAAIIVQTSQQAQKALQFFYQDQSRLPSALEFSDQDTMLNYLTGFPLPQFVSASCPQTFDYKRQSDISYTLSFCLPVASGVYRPGWNTINGSLPQ